MLGTILNTTTIIVGGTFGAIVRSGIGDKYKQSLFNALGLCCLVLGVNASLPNMAKSEYPVMFILSLAIGGVIGTKLDLAGRIDRLNAKLNARSGKENNSLNGLVTGILLYCIGTFSIVGPVLSCLSPTGGWAFGEAANTYLYTNATLDLVTSAVLAASYGWIMLLAAPVLFCWQGMFYAIAYFFGEAMPEPMRCELSIVGGVLILSSGLAILGIKDCKTVNLLPSLLVPVVFYLIKGLF
ncbi:MAG: DUF554 domain-containing protein [Bacteroidaceae bacterium]|nr:DUF554 domain-containing protein [Bacteroidaceae bacterium]